MSEPETLRLLILGAHPDDAEFHAGGLAVRYREQGHAVKIVSVTDGGAGHHRLAREELIAVRREELAAAAAIIGAEAEVWPFPDGRLTPSLDVRERIIREVRTFRPDLVLTHRTCDYHPDHRAVGQAVQDASYMVTVPLVVTDTPPLRQDPVVAAMVDLFTKPCPLEPHVLLDIEPQRETLLDMLAQHASQVFDFLPHNSRQPAPPTAPAERRDWLRAWVQEHMGPRADRFRAALADRWGAEAAHAAVWIEAYEISEYAASVAPERLLQLFMMDDRGR